MERCQQGPALCVTVGWDVRQIPRVWHEFRKPEAPNEQAITLPELVKSGPGSSIIGSGGRQSADPGLYRRIDPYVPGDPNLGRFYCS